MLIKNEIIEHYPKLKYSLVSVANIGDKCSIAKHERGFTTLREGIIVGINTKGVHFKNDYGVVFVKWCHVQHIEKELQTNTQQAKHE